MDAAWGEDANQPEWLFDSVPGMCGLSTIDTGDTMVRANRSSTIRSLVKKCRGLQTCTFEATTSSLGNVRGTEAGRCRLTVWDIKTQVESAPAFSA